MRNKAGFSGKLRSALRPLSPDDHYLVGVSGGRDSVALLHGLLILGYRNSVVCHLDHGLRAESGEDAEFVRCLALESGLQAEIGKADVRAFAREKKISLETAARDARYRFFSEVAERSRCKTLFVAHQADDQAETFLFNLLRGTGPTGLSGMRARSTRRVGTVELTVVRPLLAVWRKEIDAYLSEHNITWREDATNADPTFGTRNRLRNEALPMLSRTMGRDVRDALWRAANILGEEQAWLDKLQIGDAPPEQMQVQVLRAQPLAQQRRMVHRWLLACGVPDVGFQEVEAVLLLVEKSTDAPAKVNLPSGHHARRKAGKVFLQHPLQSFG